MWEKAKRWLRRAMFQVFGRKINGYVECGTSETIFAPRSPTHVEISVSSESCSPALTIVTTASPTPTVLPAGVPQAAFCDVTRIDLACTQTGRLSDPCDWTIKYSGVFCPV